MSENRDAGESVLIDNPEGKLPPCTRACQRAGCGATALGFMVFRFVDPDLGIVAHLPFEYRCHEHRKPFLDSTFRTEDVDRLRLHMRSLLGAQIPGYKLGKRATIFAVFTTITEREVAESLDMAKRHGLLVFAADPLPVEFVPLEDMPDPTPGISRH
jgi:hypothetical protein